jgi:hypothetical protein
MEKEPCHASLPLKSARLPLAYLPMRVLGFLAISLWLVVDLAQSQADPLPRFRPALPATGPAGLINQIDREGLLKKGQKEVSVMFCCCITTSGGILWHRTYRATPDAAALKAELERCLEKVRFSPAVYEHQPIQAVYFGTIVFGVVDDKPRLRIFGNQEISELLKENDFIGPQPIIGAGSKFSTLHYPENVPVVISGLGYLVLKIDDAGNLQDLQIMAEDPPLSGFGSVAAVDFHGAKFIPAFRAGDPVSSNITLPVFYEP